MWGLPVCYERLNYYTGPTFSEVKLTEGPEKVVKLRVAGDARKPEEDKEKDLQAHPPSEPLPMESELGQAAEKTAEEISKEDPLEAAKREAAENRDRWVRAVADLENYKKRTAQEKSRLLKYKNEDLLRDLLTVGDNIQRALSFCNQEGRSDSLVDGICMIADMFRDLLVKYGVTEIDAQGQPFDPNVHEAMGQIPRTDVQPNTVVEVIERGYMYQDRLLRAAKVLVSGAPKA